MSDMHVATQNYQWLKRIPAFLAWCMPVGLAYFGYINGITKLTILNALGAVILNWNDKTEEAIRLTLWIHAHQWIFLVPLALIALVFVIPKKRKTWAILRLVILVLITIVCLRSCELGTYLGGKLITFPDKPAESKTSPTTPSEETTSALGAVEGQ